MENKEEFYVEESNVRKSCTNSSTTTSSSTRLGATFEDSVSEELFVKHHSKKGETSKMQMNANKSKDTMDFWKFCESIKQQYNYEDSEGDISKTANKILEDLHEQTKKFEVSLGVVNNVSVDAANAENLLKVLQLNRDELLSKLNSLKKELEEKKLERKNSLIFKKDLEFRKQKAKSHLSRADKEFMNSIEKQLIAIQHLTVVVWDYPNCSDGFLRGFVRSDLFKRTKFFEGNLEPDDIWKLIEYISNNEQNNK